MADGWQASTNTGMQKPTLARLWPFSRMRNPAGKIVKLKLAENEINFFFNQKNQLQLYASLAVFSCEKSKFFT